MRTFLYLTVTVAALLLPRLALAQEGPNPDRPSPERLFKHLDANNDGQLTRDELPPRMQERFDDLLKADKNGDKKLDREEFAAAFKHLPRPEGRFRPPVERPRDSFADRRQHERSPGETDGARHDREGKGSWAHHHPRHHHGNGEWAQHRHHRDGDRYAAEGGRKGPGPDWARRVFARLDRDGDGELSFREFAMGMAMLHRAKSEAWAHEARADRPRGDGEWRHHRPESWREHGDYRPERPQLHRGPWDAMRHPFQSMFERQDKDGDGKISKSEAPERLQKHFDQIDRDKDGYVTKEELKQAMVAMMKRHQEQQADATKCAAKKAEEKKPEAKKAEAKKADEKKTVEKKPEGKK